MPEFTHLHNHTQFSLLDGQASVARLLDKAAADQQKAAAITDHGNMFGVFQFVNEAKKRGIKPIIGCEFYMVEDRFQKSFTRGKKDKRFHQLLLARNEEGYRNISKLCSLGYIEGKYSKFPRIDKDLLRQYKEGLIATSCCIGAEIPQAILFEGEEVAEKLLLEWLDLFGEYFFIELQRHGLGEIDGSGKTQEDVNQVLIKWAKKYDIPLIATNDSHYVDEEDAPLQEILLCINTATTLNTPVGRGKGKRFAFANNQFYFKTGEEMATLFSDVPQAIENTMRITDMIDTPSLTRDVLLPHYTLPEAFKTQGEYLRYLTFEGARKRYGEITEEIRERLDFELQVIENSGYPGYFLIVQDFTTAARELGVWVGPGRGSAAGSAVAYCIGITNVDPLKYNLLFERFLNPDRVSMPDIDIDFDDEGRQKVIDYVTDKYGKEQVAQIITYGTMAAKSSLRDVGRVLDVKLADVDKATKDFPTHLSASLGKIVREEGVDPGLAQKMNSDDLAKAKNFQKMAFEKNEVGKMIRQAKELEGSIRNTGVHACGVIITPDDIRNYVPVATAKDSDLWVTQFDNSVVESAGLLKMDFLGLKTLSIIKDAMEIVEERHGIKLDPDTLPLDDQKTYELFQKGHTNGIFQFESPGMQKHLKALKPTQIEDLIAMNALYRPGPLEYIPDFIARKHGKKEIVYDLPEMEEYLKETYGITVYQEQVMLLSQKLAGFTKGQADMLRKGMGKKKKHIVDELYPKFVEGCQKNGHPKKVVDKIWKDWEAFASYAFNKSHSACYSYLSYQTAYLKANYPEAFMASVLGHNMSSQDKVTFFLEECKRMKIPVLGPDVNESNVRFTVNKKGEIRFALSAIKGVGQSAVEELVAQRNEDGEFKDIHDFVSRVNLRAVNKKSMEALAMAGAFDCFEEIHRSQYFQPYPGEFETSFINKLVQFGNRMQQGSETNQQSLFGGENSVEIAKPKPPKCEPWPFMEKLQKERDATGIYLSAHPLDRYETALKAFRNTVVSKVLDKPHRRVLFGGIINAYREGYTKRSGDKFAIFKIEDYEGSMEFGLFRKDFLQFAHMVRETGTMLFIEGKTIEGRGKNKKVYLQIQNIYPLSELMEKQLDNVELHIQADTVNDKWVDRLIQLIQHNKGDYGMRIHLHYHEEESMKNKALTMLSRTCRIDVNDNMLNALKNDLEIDYRLVGKSGN